MPMMEERSNAKQTKTGPWRRLAAAGIIGIGVVYLISLYAMGLTNRNAANRDYVEYWAAGRQLVQHADPYDPAAIYRLESNAGMEWKKARVSFSPPLILYFEWPLGYVSPKTGLIIWLIVSLGALSLANILIWQLNGRPDSRYHLLGYLFAPALACQMAGQISTFLLLAVLLFLYLQPRHPFLAGAVLVPCALKPHLFLPLFLVLMLWSIFNRKIRMLAGLFLTLLAACAFTLVMDAQSWSQYSAMMRTTGVLNAFIPTLSVGLRWLVDPQAGWIQFIPEACACIWGIWYFYKHRDHWNWLDHGMLLLLVSLICTPYAWFSDEAIALAAVMAALYRAVEKGRSLIFLACVAVPALIEVFAGAQLTSPYYLWTPLGWLAWYLYATGKWRLTIPVRQPVSG